jgi:mitochondrial fission 1 protein
VLRAQYEKEGEYVGVQTKFNYAWVCSVAKGIFFLEIFGPILYLQTITYMKQGLIKSNLRPDQQEGVRLLSEIFRTAPERRRECLYYLALGNYKLGNYAESRRYNDLLLDKEPNNLQAGSLMSLIDDKVAKEGLMGVAILGGVAVAAGIVGGLIFRGTKRR